MSTKQERRTLPLSGKTQGLLNRARSASTEAPVTAHLLLLLFREDEEAARRLTELGIQEAYLLRSLRTTSEESSGTLERALERARRMAGREGDVVVRPRHLFEAILHDPASAATRSLRGLLGSTSPSSSGRPSLPSPAVETRRKRAAPPATMPPPSPLRRNREPTAPRHEASSSKAPPPSRHEPSPPRARARQRPATHRRHPTARARPLTPPTKPEPASRSHEGAHALDPRRTPWLARCCDDAIQMHEEGCFDPVIGREEQVEQILEILGRRDAPHALIVAPPGAGKSSMLGALAARWADRPDDHATRLLRMRPEALIAGSGVRGALAERFDALSSEAASLAPRVVFFLDDLHTFLGGEGPEEFVSLLETQLAVGSFRMVATMSEAAHGALGARSAALLRRFTPVVLQPTDPEQTETILQALAPRYAVHHGVTFRPDALRAAVELSNRFLGTPAQPARALSVLDQAAARTVRRGEGAVGRFAVAHIVARLARLPAERLLCSDAERLLELRERLGERLVGHEEALDRIAATLRRAAAGFRGDRPMASFLLLGPTGVGKTETARAVADILFDGAMVRLDMAEFSEAHAVARLLGAPPGYIGHEEGGQLTEAVRRKPYQLVLLDEIEKAHPQVWLALLSLLDEGRLTDGRGRTADFRHTVVVMTSNLGAEASSEAPRRPMGFGTGSEEEARGRREAEQALAAARAKLPPELWNRIDATLWFGPLRRAELAAIAAMRLRRLAETVRRHHGVTLRWDPDVLQTLLDAGGWDPKLGARPMRRTIERLVEEPLADALLEGRLARAEEVSLVPSPDGLHLHVRRRRNEAPEAAE